MGKGFVDRLVGDAIAQLAQTSHSCEHGGGILLLAEAAQFAEEVRVFGRVELPAAVTLPGRVEVHALLGKEDRGIHLAGLVDEYLFDFALCLTDDYGDAVFDDAGLLVGDLGQGVPQHLHMVVADVGNHAQVGSDDVGTVETSAQSYLDDGCVDRLAGKIVEGHHHGQLEKRGVNVERGSQMLLGKVDDLLAGNHLAVDAYALSEVHQVGRCIQPRFIAVELQYRGQQMRY